MGTRLFPLEGYALVKLGSKYKNIVASSKSYEGKSSGILVSFKNTGEEPHELDSQIGSRVFWEELQEGAKLATEEGEFAFVALKDIQGYESE